MIYHWIQISTNYLTTHPCLLGKKISSELLLELEGIVMENLKKFCFCLFNIAYPLVAFYLTNNIVMNLKDINIDVFGALLLSIFLIIPYAILKFLSCFRKSTHQYYFIVENVWLMIFTIISLRNPDMEYAVNVWGMAFVGITIVDTIHKILEDRKSSNI